MDTPDFDALLANLDDDPEFPAESERIDIAVIGIAARVGETRSPDEFWEALAGGVDLIRAFPDERRADADELVRASLGRGLSEAITPYGYLDDVDRFDPERFVLAPSEAALMDPHQRQFLTVAMESIEDAGYGGDALRGSRTGVYLATAPAQGLYTAGLEPRDAAAAGMAVSGGLTSIIAGRLNHLLDLRGPALVIDTACSSSMTAIVTACRDLRAGEVDTAVVGGARLTLVPPEESRAGFGIESASGRTRTFSADADGTGGGEGVIAFVLKPLAAALSAGDHVYGVIRGAALNHDGASAAVTAPNAAAQSDVLRSAWRDAGIDPTTIGYIEAHGTATELGDPVEITGITDAFASYTDLKAFCGIGTVKTNVGHLDALSGAAGLLKVLLMLQHRRIPASLHFTAPNPALDLAASPVYVCDRLTEWSGPGPLRAGVSSFGLSGTNGHLVIEEPPVAAPRAAEVPVTTAVPLAAQSPAALRAAVLALRDELTAKPHLRPADIGFTLSVGRSAFDHRVCFVADSAPALLSLADRFLAGHSHPRIHHARVRVSATAGPTDPSAIDLERERELTRDASTLCEKVAATAAPADRSTLDRLADLFVGGARVPWARLHSGRDVRRLSFPAYEGSPRRVWRPAGPSVAAAGISVLHPLVHRHVVEGRDLDVFESELTAATTLELGEHVINGQHVLVGTAVIEMATVVASRLLGGRVVLSNLHYRDPLVTHGAETRLLQCVATRQDDVLTLEFRSRLVGTRTWVEHCRADARMMRPDERPDEYIDIARLRTVYDAVGESVSYFREMVQTEGAHWRSSRELFYGPGGEALLRFSADPETSRLKKHYTLFPPILDSGVNLGLLRESEPFLPLAFGRAVFAEDLPDEGYSWIVPVGDLPAGTDVRSYDISFTDLDGRVIGRVERYSVSRVKDPGTFLRADDSTPSLHILDWRAVPAGDLVPAGSMLLSGDAETIGQFAELLEPRVPTVVTMPDAWGTDQASVWWSDRIDKDNIARIVHVLPVLPDSDADRTEHVLRPVFRMVTALARASLRSPVDIVLVTRHGQAVRPGEPVDADARAVAAAALCFAVEYPNLRLRVVDTDSATTAAEIIAVFGTVPARRIMALRGGTLHEQSLVPAPAGDGTNVLDDISGLVVVSGGLGGMALAFADRLTESGDDVTVALLTRSCDDTDPDGLPEQLERRLAATGGRRERILVRRADVTDEVALERCLDALRAEHGPIVGVLHTAGLAGDGFAITKDWDAFADVLGPKTTGTRLLERHTDADPLRFFALCSSLTGVIGAPGQSDYAAANAYLDATAARLRAAGRPAVSIDWTGWSESGMAHRHGITGEGFIASFVDDKDGVDLLAAAIATPAAQVIAARFLPDEVARQRADLEAVLDVSSVAPAVVTETAPRRRAARGRDVHVNGLAGRELEPIERDVVEVWCSTLGTDEVGMNDQFFETGGNSLLASRLQLDLDARFPNTVNIADIFSYPSVALLSAFITSRVAPPAEVIPPVAASDSDDTALSDLLDAFLTGRVDIDAVIDR
ncbi:KR domain-containing protein [Cryobacterium sp. 1639]|uniref:beta-ketoacyl synthase N-terminal-like domain-containing protein n=1 Tax=Cryobacterium inferilacus TaxID=2866629 RepID=UPI001C73351A|nr:beta-ketoacyl synthase N-terminal-like domain-containing protein [Cryobacterium sp. 1639]MBX0301905.1 KR domain-containing protein [Cryobacterium sp. 1639]